MEKADRKAKRRLERQREKLKRKNEALYRKVCIAEKRLADANAEHVHNRVLIEKTNDAINQIDRRNLRWVIADV